MRRRHRPVPTVSWHPGTGRAIPPRPRPGPGGRAAGPPGPPPRRSRPSRLRPSPRTGRRRPWPRRWPGERPRSRRTTWPGPGRPGGGARRAAAPGDGSGPGRPSAAIIEVRASFPGSTRSPHRRKWTSGKRPLRGAAAAARRKFAWSLNGSYRATSPMSVASGARPSSRRTSHRAAGAGRKTSVSKPLGMTVSRSAAKPRRASYAARADSEQQTTRVGSRRDSRAHAATVIEVVRS